MLSVAKAGKHFVILRQGLTVGHAYATRREAEEAARTGMAPRIEIDELKSAALMSVLRECVEKQSPALRTIKDWVSCECTARNLVRSTLLTVERLNVGTAEGRRMINNYIMRYAIAHVSAEWQQNFRQSYFKFAT